MTNEKSLRRIFVCFLALFVFSPMAIAMEKDYLDFWEILECPNEDIEIEGSVRFQFHETGKGWVFQAFWTGEGLGLNSGDEYRLQGKWMEVVQERRPFIMYWNDHFQLVGKGQAPNYRFYSRIRFFVDENGEWVPEFVDEEWPCPTQE